MGPLAIVASQDIGSLGPPESSPASIHWRWYYHCPALGLWVLLAALLIVVKPNRRLQAWLIWLPVLAVSLGWSMLARLLFMPPQGAEPGGDFFATLAASWAAVWLLAPWLAGRRVATALAVALLTMLCAGGLFYLSAYDMDSAEGRDFSLILYPAAALALLLATALTARFCRQAYRPRRFLAWLLLWTLVVPIVSIPVVAIVTGVLAGEGLLDFAVMLVMAVFPWLIGGAVLGGALYLVNLPFLLLAMRNAFFGARFQDVLRLTPAVSGPVQVAETAGDAPPLDAILGTLVKEP